MFNLFKKKPIKDKVSARDKALSMGLEEGSIVVVTPISKPLYLKKEDLNCVECGRKISEVYIPVGIIIIICCCGCLDNAKGIL